MEINTEKQKIMNNLMSKLNTFLHLGLHENYMKLLKENPELMENDNLIITLLERCVLESSLRIFKMVIDHLSSKGYYDYLGIQNQCGNTILHHIASSCLTNSTNRKMLSYIIVNCLHSYPKDTTIILNYRQESFLDCLGDLYYKNYFTELVENTIDIIKEPSS